MQSDDEGSAVFDAEVCVVSYFSDAKVGRLQG